MKNIKRRKGFTIVELVIVIGVIGVLAGILIPTFVNVTKKAEEAALKSDLANAYSAYVADAAGDYTVDDPSKNVKGYDADEDADKVFTIELIDQDAVVLVKDSVQYKFISNAWQAASAALTVDNIVTEKGSDPVEARTAVYGTVEIMKEVAA